MLPFNQPDPCKFIVGLLFIYIVSVSVYELGREEIASFFKPWFTEGHKSRKARRWAVGMAGTLALLYFNHLSRKEIFWLSIPIAFCLAYGFSGFVIRDGLSSTARTIRGTVVFALCLTSVTFYGWIFWPPLPVISLGCAWSHLPIHISSGSTTHVLLVSPIHLIKADDTKDWMIGPFTEFSNTSGKDWDWPSAQDGRWMTQDEKQNSIANGIANDVCYKCQLTNTSGVTLDDSTLFILADTLDKKRHVYRVTFDPLRPGQSFQFFTVNLCSFGEIPPLIQWSTAAFARISEDTKQSQIELHFEQRAWPPGSVISSLGPSAFVWNGIPNCEWK